MTNSPHQKLTQLLVEVLYPSLLKYVLDSYRAKYPKYEYEVIKLLQSSSNYWKIQTQFNKEKKALEEIVDLHDCLRYLMLKNWNLFKDKLGHIGMSYVSIVYSARTDWAHPTKAGEFTFAKVQYVAETTAFLLDLISDKVGAKTARGLADEISLVREKTEESDAGIEFSQTVKKQLLLFNQTVAQLTESQYAILSFLRGHRRVAIAGCAGSGKTLVAVEKAHRLAHAGLTVLILCHNPFLAKYIRTLCLQTSVRVLGFTEWLQILRGHPVPNLDDWTHFEEPTEVEIDEALERALEFRESEKYDAIIVDEGQDFRDEWWDLIECSLIENGVLYIFHDDNQALLPGRKKYPITQAPFILSTNCRNAGEIFNLVARLHPQAPEPTRDLAGKGIVRQFKFKDADDFAKIIADAITAAIQSGLKVHQLTLLTTEHEPIENSVLYGLRLSIVGGQVIIVSNQRDESDRLTIPLFTVSSYKGLESDGVILFVLYPREELNAYLYVGFSRARFLLYVVINDSFAHRVPQM